MNKSNNLTTKKILIFTIFLIVVIIIAIYFLILNGKKDKDISNNNVITNEEFSQDDNVNNTNTVNDIQNVIKEPDKNESIEENSVSNNTEKKDSEDKYTNTYTSKSNSSSKTSNKDKEESSNIPSSHKHTWVNHTKKVWIPNIVTIVDEPEKEIQGAQLYTKQPDGTWLSNGETYWFENGFTKEDFKKILSDKIKNENYIGNYVNRTKTIPAKTHTEDKGHYEEQVDYQYCSECGKRK